MTAPALLSLAALACAALSAWPGPAGVRLPLAAAGAAGLLAACLRGPVGRWELARAAHRDPGFGRRVLYPLTLLGVLLSCYLAWVPPPTRGGWLEFLDPPALDPDKLAKFAEATALALLAVQAVAAGLMTPVMAAPVVCGDRTRKTLDFLLATPLSDLQIVGGKYAAVVAVAGATLLTGLPVFALMPLLGGVEPVAVGCAFAATAAAVLSVAAVGVAASAAAPDPARATGAAYRDVLFYLAVTAALVGFLRLKPQAAAWPGPGAWLTVQDVADALAAANPVAVAGRVEREVRSGGDLAEVLPRLLADFALLHLAAAFAFVALACRRLRGPAAAAEPAPGKPAAAPAAVRRPPVGDDPVGWKECYVDGPAAANLARPGAALASGLLAYSVLLVHLAQWARSGKPPLDAMHTWVQAAGAVLAVGGLVSVAGAAARSVGKERDRQALDSLLTTDVTPAELLRGKRLGAVRGVRWIEIWLVVHWLAAAAAGALVWAAVPLLWVAWRVFVGFAAGVGMLFAAREQDTEAAARRTLLAGLGASLVPWLVWLVSPAFVEPRGEADWFLRRQAAFLTPPVMMAALAQTPAQFRTFVAGPTAWVPAAQALAAVLLYAVAAWWTWRRALAVFPRVLGLPDAGGGREPPVSAASKESGG